MLVSENIYLRLVEYDDAANLVAWRNDPEISRFFFNTYPLSLVGQKIWFEKLFLNETKKLFVICLRNGDEPIGTIGLDAIDFKNQRAEYGNVLIGDKRYCGQGLAKEASITLLNYAFFELNMNRVYLYVTKENESAIRLYEKIGFVSEGIIREWHFSAGKFNDVVMMGCLRREYIDQTGAAPDA